MQIYSGLLAVRTKRLTKEKKMQMGRYTWTRIHTYSHSRAHRQMHHHATAVMRHECSRMVWTLLRTCDLPSTCWTLFLVLQKAKIAAENGTLVFCTSKLHGISSASKQMAWTNEWMFLLYFLRKPVENKKKNIINFWFVLSGDAYGKNRGATKELMRKTQKNYAYSFRLLTSIGLLHFSLSVCLRVYLFCAHLIILCYAVLHVP